MKLFLIEQPADLKWVTPGKIYDGDLVPTIIDRITMEPVPPSYIIRCDDGKSRKMDASFFITVEELREKKLKELLD